MTELKVSLACTQTDRSAPILDGRIPISGCKIIPLPGETQDIFRRALDDKAFDIAEMSMSSYIVTRSRGYEDYIAVPVYLSRSFRHSSIYIRADRGIGRPEDLAGKRIGLEQYQQTVALWVRGLLGDHHGVKTQDVKWRSGGLEKPGGGERLALTLPPGIDLEAIPKNQTLNGMLAGGDLDAVIATRPPSCFGSGKAPVARLFPNYMQAEIEYFKAGRTFPIMHVLIVRRRLADEHPWLPVEIFRAFCKAKAMALKDLTMMNISRISMAWIVEQAAQTREILGDNMWAYGLSESRHELEAMLRYAHNDGLIDAPLKPEDLFHPSTHGLRDAV